MIANVAVPGVVGIPEIFPLEASSDSPAGREPEVTAKVIDPSPSTVTVNAYSTPAVPATGAPEVNTGVVTTERTPPPASRRDGRRPLSRTPACAPAVTARAARGAGGRETASPGSAAIPM